MNLLLFLTIIIINYLITSHFITKNIKQELVKVKYFRIKALDFHRYFIIFLFKNLGNYLFAYLRFVAEVQIIIIKAEFVIGVIEVLIRIAIGAI